MVNVLEYRLIVFVIAHGSFAVNITVTGGDTPSSCGPGLPSNIFFHGFIVLPLVPVILKRAYPRDQGKTQKNKENGKSQFFVGSRPWIEKSADQQEIDKRAMSVGAFQQASTQTNKTNETQW